MQPPVRLDLVAVVAEVAARHAGATKEELTGLPAGDVGAVLVDDPGVDAGDRLAGGAGVHGGRRVEREKKRRARGLGHAVDHLERRGGHPLVEAAHRGHGLVA